MKFKTWITTAIAGAALLAVGPVAAQEKLTVWWAKGFYKAEDDALFAAIKKFEAKNPKIKIDLSLYAPQEAIPKVVAALDANNPPDVAYGDVFDFQVYVLAADGVPPRWRCPRIVRRVSTPVASWSCCARPPIARRCCTVR